MALGDIFNLVTKSWEQNTPAWIIISGILGGIITQILKLIFEQTIPQWQRNKATRIAIHKYRYPISKSASTLTSTIQKILDNPNILRDANRRLNVLYDFGCFFGWIEILLNEIFVEVIERPDRLKNYGARYHYYLNELLRGITEDYYLSSDYNKILFEIVRSLVIPRLALNSIGQLMIDHSQHKETDNSFSKVINLSEFISNYEHSDDYKKWFMYIDNILSEIHKSKSSPQWNMLIILQVHILLFNINVSIKKGIFSSNWIPSEIKLMFSKVLWLPFRIRKYLRILPVLIKAYRTDDTIYEAIVGVLFKKEKRNFGDSVKRDSDESGIQDIKKIVVENDDHLQYNSNYILKKYPDLTMYYFEHGSNEQMKLLLAVILSDYFDTCYVDRDIFLYLRKKFSRRYLTIIDKPYYEYLSYLDNSINLQPDAETWNEKGVLYTHLIGDDSRRSNKLIDYYDLAFDCYDKAIKMKSYYTEAWNNKGLAYIERPYYYDRESDYNKAIECFGNALEIANKDKHLPKENYNADIWNNLGVCYYELGDYNKAIECFGNALEIDSKFELANNNKAITMQKRGKKKKMYTSDGKWFYQ